MLKGAAWGRPDDRVGVGGIIDALSPEARNYFAAGGLGILIGDGQLNYRQEKILEAFYAYSVNSQVTVFLDYQLIANPAYNADRGPVSIISGRLHAEFKRYMPSRCDRPRSAECATVPPTLMRSQMHPMLAIEMRMPVGSASSAKSAVTPCVTRCRVPMP